MAARCFWTKSAIWICRCKASCYVCCKRKYFERVGGNERIDVDVRVVAATNRDLEKMAAQGRFRDDLYYRLNGFTINMPPLRERGEDLELLVHIFSALASNELAKT